MVLEVAYFLCFILCNYCTNHPTYYQSRGVSTLEEPGCTHSIRVHDCVQKLVYRVPFPRYHGHTALCDELQFLAREYADIAQLYR